MIRGAIGAKASATSGWWTNALNCAVYHEMMMSLSTASTRAIRFVQGRAARPTASTQSAYANELDASVTSAATNISSTYFNEGSLKQKMQGTRTEEYQHNYFNRMNLYVKTVSGSTQANWSDIFSPTGQRVSKQNICNHSASAS